MSGVGNGAGRLDQRVTVERRTVTPDGGGGGAESWVPVATVWAEVRPLSGTERAAAPDSATAGRIAVTTLRVRLRRNPALALTAADRLLWQGVVHAIRAVADPGPRQPFLTLDCEAGGAP